MSIGLITKGMLAGTTRVVNIGEFMIEGISVALDSEISVEVQLEADVTI